MKVIRYAPWMGLWKHLEEARGTREFMEGTNRSGIQSLRIDT